MNAEKNNDYRFSAAGEFLLIALLKITIALLVFTFSAGIVQTVKAYTAQADNWMKDTSRVISLRILDLYR
jgi:uncharacterized membrane protein YidH (DUF202 family)